MNLRFGAQRLAWSALLPLWVVSVCATAVEPLANDDALSDLVRLLQEETDIATHTKLNIDFVPGMVTVLHGKDLLAKGARTVGEALAVVPGVEYSIAGDGQPQFLVRGIGKTFASGKVKMMLNGVSMNATVNAVSSIYAIPVEQVDRIEVIRGPGSAIYGEYAYSGVVDVITHDTFDNAYARYSSYDIRSFGGAYHYDSPDKTFGVALNASMTDGDGPDVSAGKDKLWDSQFISKYGNWTAKSNAPGASNEAERNRFIDLNVHYRDVNVLVQHVSSGFGDHFGVFDVLPDAKTDIVRSLSITSLEVRKPWTLGAASRFDGSVGWNQYYLDNDGQQIFPKGFGNKFTTQGAIGNPYYEEQKLYTHGAWSYGAWAGHEFLLGFDLARTEQGATYVERNYHYTGTALVDDGVVTKHQGTDNWLDENLSRNLLAVFVQDQYAATNSTTLTAGLRVDHYTDVGTRTTPRLAAVYQWSKTQTFKFQFSEAFRPPTFLELHTRKTPVVQGNPDLQPEQLRNFEIGYVFNNGVTVARVTTYHADMKDLIVIDTSGQYQNIRNVDTNGVEMELQQPLARRLKLDANVSYAHPQSDADEGALWGTAQWMSNVGVLWEIYGNGYLALQYRHIGESARETVDTRPPLSGYDTFDLTYSMFQSAQFPMRVALGVKNLFDADVVYAAPHNTYAGDYPRPGREWWLSIAYTP